MNSTSAKSDLFLKHARCKSKNFPFYTNFLILHQSWKKSFEESFFLTNFVKKVKKHRKNFYTVSTLVTIFFMTSLPQHSNWPEKASFFWLWRTTTFNLPFPQINNLKRWFFFVLYTDQDNASFVPLLLSCWCRSFFFNKSFRDKFCVAESLQTYFFWF